MAESKSSKTAKAVDPIIKKWEERFQQEATVRKSYRNSCSKIEDIFTGTTSPYSNNTEDDASYNYNILWVNCYIFLAALYSRNPNPDVRRRYKDAVDRIMLSKIPDERMRAMAFQKERRRIENYNDVGKNVAILFERALSFVQDTEDYFGAAEDAVMSFVKFAGGLLRVKYDTFTSEGMPKRITLRKDVDKDEYRTEDGELYMVEDFDSVQQDEEGGFFVESETEFEEELEHEELGLEWVPINNFRWEPNAEWQDVGWCAIEHYLNKEELEDQFGKEIAAKIPLTYTEEGAYISRSQKKKKGDAPTQALVYECFDKRERKVQVFAKDYAEVLEDVDDPWELSGFYPFPKPMFGTMGDDNINPIPDYLYYQDQHTELNTITYRIHRLLETIKYRGFYDGAIANAINVENMSDGDFVPLPDFAKFASMEGGRLDLNNHIATLPIQEARALLQDMFGARDQVIRVIYEMTGISDIVRGSSKASETLGAQELKSQYANLRLQPKTQEVERFFRDLKRIEAEFMADHFEMETLEGMTGMSITPEMEEVISSDLLRTYIVDIETDSTVVMDSSREQRERSEALSAMASMMNQFLPLAQAGVDKEIIIEFILFGLKGFKGARELEDVLRDAMDSGQAPAAPAQQAPQVTEAENAETRLKNAQATNLETDSTVKAFSAYRDLVNPQA